MNIYYHETTGKILSNLEFIELCAEKSTVMKWTGQDVMKHYLSNGWTKITKENAKEFYRNLCETVNGNADKTCQLIMSEDMIAEKMKLPVEKATAFLLCCARNGITERQGGAWVI